ncbi:MAG: putative polymerase epsilon subunit [Actinomycetota bacterium]
MQEPSGYRETSLPTHALSDRAPPYSAYMADVSLPSEDTGTPLSEVIFCVLDIETAGGSPDGAGITEIAAVKYQGGYECERFNVLIHPETTIPSFIVMLTGISDSMVRNAPPIREHIAPLLEFIGDSVLVAHNARFDIGFINAALDRFGQPPLANKVVDTLQLARRLIRSEVPNCKLSTLAASLNLNHQPIHRALDDVLATGDLLHYLIERASSLGTQYLEDLIALPQIGSHPQSGKLKLTESLPRTTGVYFFVDAHNDILYVGKASNIRSRVRSYFGTGESRNKVGKLLKIMQGVHYIETPDILTAEVLESRIISRAKPRYNHAGTRADKYSYVRFTTDEEWPRLVVTKVPSPKGITIGPFTTKAMARDIVDAIESVIPLSRCTVRMGRNYTAPADAEVCSAARLGLAQCPCSGTADPQEYARLVDVVSRTLLGEPSEVISLLTKKMAIHAEAQRFEDAAYIRDRIENLQTALKRQQQAQSICRSGDLVIEHAGIIYEISNGILINTRRENELFAPMKNSGIPVEHLTAPPESAIIHDSLVRTDALNEVMCIARFLEKNQLQV